jgi:hypothetical protein
MRPAVFKLISVRSTISSSTEASRSTEAPMASMSSIE